MTKWWIKAFWLLAGVGVLAYLWSKREIRATVTAGEPTLTYRSHAPATIWEDTYSPAGDV